jgi:threonine aldolase
LFSKTRFIAAQFEAYLENDLWLDLACHANEMTQRLAARIRSSSVMRLAHEPQANEIFAIVSKAQAERMRREGAAFYDWNMPHTASFELGDDEVLVRLVTSFATKASEIDALKI